VNPQATDLMAGLALDYAKKGDPKRGMDFIRRARAIDKATVELIYIQAVIETWPTSRRMRSALYRKLLKRDIRWEKPKPIPKWLTCRANPSSKRWKRILPLRPTRRRCYAARTSCLAQLHFPIRSFYKKFRMAIIRRID